MTTEQQTGRRAARELAALASDDLIHVAAACRELAAIISGRSDTDTDRAREEELIGLSRRLDGHAAAHHGTLQAANPEQIADLVASLNMAAQPVYAAGYEAGRHEATEITTSHMASASAAGLFDLAASLVRWAISLAGDDFAAGGIPRAARAATVLARQALGRTPSSGTAIARTCDVLYFVDSALRTRSNDIDVQQLRSALELLDAITTELPYRA